MGQRRWRGVELANKVLKTLEEKPSNFKVLYNHNESITSKLNTIAKEIYGANGVTFTANAKKSMTAIEQNNLDKLPICVAKTQYSLSDDPALLGRPENFEITIKELRVSAGAGFIVALAGDVMTMPGLPKKPAAFDIDVNEEGDVVGLF